MRWLDTLINFWYNETRPPFLSREAIVESLVARLTREDRNYIACSSKKDLIKLHFTFGMWIRNEYRLWHPENPLTVGYESGEDSRHPDNLSYDIIVDVWERLGGKDDSIN